MRLNRPLLAALGALLLARGAVAAGAPDPYLWLEEVGSARAMAWVNAHNAVTTAALERDPAYAATYAEALKLAQARDRIPAPRFEAGAIWNFWQDAEHVRGVWRRTTLADYREAEPHWVTALDLDALSAAEHANWVWKGATCAEPAERRCLVALSDGGEDAETSREFDLAAGAFVADGFVLPRAKQRVDWEDEDTLLIAREWTAGDLTPAGYPYIVKRLRRGQPLAAAVEVFRGSKADAGYGVSPTVLRDGAGASVALIDRPLDTFRHETWVLTPVGAKRLAIPEKATARVMVAGRVVIELDEAWTPSPGGRTFPAGSLVAVDRAALLADPAHLSPTLVHAAGPRESLGGVTASRDRLLVGLYDNVRGRGFVYTPVAGGGWSRAKLDLPDDATVAFADADLRSDLAFVGVSGFLDPSSLWLVDAASARAEKIKSLAPKFDASRDVVEQFEATSSDGARIPYFVVHDRAIRYDGANPTLLYAYGGFQVSETPTYSAGLGKLWLERGGVYVLANIRGGGEFGPKWHEAGLKTHRQLVYDDFAAVARDLIARGITSPRRLGIRGGSNGGLLMGVEFTQHPELWNAVVIDVPLLDMIRIGKIAAGASWSGEYGDVDTDPAARAFWEKTSPYDALKAGVAYPQPFIFTTTKDDRVGPQHARKFAARMEAMGLPFLFYENTEGGHGAGANLRQQAHTQALEMIYLREKLMN